MEKDRPDSKPLPPKPKPLNITKRDLMARLELASKGINPIDMIKEVFDESMRAYRSGRGFSESYDAGPTYLAVSFQCAKRMSEFYAPTWKPVDPEHLKDMLTESDATKVEALDADRIRQVILNDPFAKKHLEVYEKNTLPFGLTTVNNDKPK